MNIQNHTHPLTHPLLICLAAAVLAGCATRPPREMGAPGPVMMPPAAPATEDPPPVTVEEVKDSIVSEPMASPPPPARKLEPRAGTPYTVKKGESLSSIASRHNMSWRKLADYNYLTNPDLLKAGQVILIPPAASGGSPKAATSEQVQPPPAPLRSGDTYVVQSGDSLSVIAERHDTSVKALKQVNNLVSDRLLVGQVLKLPQGASSGRSGTSEMRFTPAPRPTPVATRPVPTPRPTPIPVDVDAVAPEDLESGVIQENTVTVDQAFPIVVQEGDTLESIANDYIVSVKEVRELNNLAAGAVLKPGQKLLIPPSQY